MMPYPILFFVAAPVAWFLPPFSGDHDSYFVSNVLPPAFVWDLFDCKFILVYNRYKIIARSNRIIAFFCYSAKYVYCQSGAKCILMLLSPPLLVGHAQQKKGREKKWCIFLHVLLRGFFVLNFRTVAIVGSSVRMVMMSCLVRFTKYPLQAFRT